MTPQGAGSAILRVEGTTRRFGRIVAVDHIDLEVGRGEFFSLLGPSGCGKTTLLRLIAGFEPLDTGRILLDGVDLGPLPPHRRPVNTVFQHYALFPHLSVFENVAFGLRRRHTSDPEVRTRVAEVLALVRLQGFEDRMPIQLSGGQRQRVALARALVLKPRILLLDEPLGALDHQLRVQMQVELKALQRVCGITFLFVTHDQNEALAMSDRIAVLSEGRVVQVGTGEEIYERPRTEFVARFMGASNLLNARVHDLVDGRARVAIRRGPECELPVPEAIRLDPDQDVRVMLRPEWLSLALEAPREPGWASWPVRVEDRHFLGAFTSFSVSGLGEDVVELNMNSNGHDGHDPLDAVRPGDPAFLVWRSGLGVLLAADEP